MVGWKTTTAKILVIKCFDKSQLSIIQLLNQNNFNLLTMFKLWVILYNVSSCIYPKIDIYKQCFYKRSIIRVPFFSFFQFKPDQTRIVRFQRSVDRRVDEIRLEKPAKLARCGWQKLKTQSRGFEVKSFRRSYRKSFHGE